MSVLFEVQYIMNPLALTSPQCAFTPSRTVLVFERREQLELIRCAVTYLPQQVLSRNAELLIQIEARLESPLRVEI